MREGEFMEYFSFEAILGDVIRNRMKGRKIGKLLPARKYWSRAGVRSREGMKPEAVRRQAIWRTVMAHRRNGTLEDMEWGRNLVSFTERVQNAVADGKVTFKEPRMIQIPKGQKDGRPEYRTVASFDDLDDRVILSRMTAYVRDALEGVLAESCYSFRKDPAVNHQLAVKRLQEWRERHAGGEMFVAECDIRKFFDNISHEVVRKSWKEMRFDSAAERILEAYLSVYSSSGTERRGLPQGGSFSTVLANLVLMAADAAVVGTGHEDLFYARYCDDVIFVHPDRTVCGEAMSVYQAALEKLELPIHPVEPFVYRPADGAKTAYYTIKSKGPFRWAEAASGESGCAPWVSFLGSQVRYDGETRIRKESVERHIRALGHETAKIVRAIARGELDGLTEQGSFARFARFRNHLISKGVGYVTAKVKDCDMCWAGAFPNVTACRETAMQMRRLDRVREGMLSKVWKGVCERMGTNRGAMGSSRPTRRYKGRPFSYFGFLEKAVRPTNMAFRRRKGCILPYSEL